MMIKLQDLCFYFLQAFAVRSSGWNDCHKQPGSMVWIPRAAAVMPHRAATVVSWMLASIVCQLRLTMVSINQLPLTWSTIMYDVRVGMVIFVSRPLTKIFMQEYREDVRNECYNVQSPPLARLPPL